ncbi:MAG: hypothetical protein M1376_17075 [Planctomycetes bacterium]|nr:hypothetical protein [Planctomycetota bacterium]
MTARLFKSIRWLFSPRSSVCAYAVAAVLIGILLLTFCTVFVPVWYRHRCEDRISEVRATLRIVRRAIAIQHEESGRYPTSFAELRDSLSRGSPENWGRMHVDLTTSRRMRVPEYRQLNDKGGYYYDPNNGDIKLNLTRPVREYFLWYTGKYADQVPSDW